MKLTSRERIMRLFKGEEVDRPGLKLWGMDMDLKLLNPAYGKVISRAYELSDIFATGGSDFDIYFGKSRNKYEEVKTVKIDGYRADRHITIHTPLGTLKGIQRISFAGEPSYTIEYPIKEPEDVGKILSIPYEPFEFNKDAYFLKQGLLGDRGIVMYRLDQAGYALHRLMGTENFSYIKNEYREELTELVDVFYRRIEAHLKEALMEKIPGPFGWVGPELFIPPLASPSDFEHYVFERDKKLCDIIHGENSHVWVHCHGKVRDFIGRFIHMGVDILNPLEPPKNGDVDLDEIISLYGNSIGLEGNIEIQDIIQSKPEELKDLIEKCVASGSKSGRFILCPSAGFMEYPFPEPEYIENLMLYLEHGYKCVNSYKGL